MKHMRAGRRSEQQFVVDDVGDMLEGTLDRRGSLR